MTSDSTCETLAGIFCEYKSIRFIRVRNVKLSIIYWLTMFLVLCYVVAFTIFYDKGYQTTEQVTGTTSAKLKGSGSICNINGTQYCDENTAFEDLTPVDAMDLVQPSMEENAFFIITARTITPNQTRGICEGNDDVGLCNIEDTVHPNCTEYFYDPESQGIFTGNCSVNGRCEMYSWCPLEIDEDPFIQYVEGLGVFTAFVKIDVNFEKFNVDRSNVYDKFGNFPTIGYNLFEIDDMLSKATNGAVTSYKNVSRRGAIILVSSIWNCNLDNDLDECNPEFRFKRIDGEQGTISTGYNFRTVTYDTNEDTRYLRKYYGLRFIFVTEGTAGKFDFAALTVTFGAGLAYLGVAALIADLVLERFLPESKTYVEAKHRDILADTAAISLVPAPSHSDDKNGYHSTTNGNNGKI